MLQSQFTGSPDPMASHGCGPGRFACRHLARRGSAAGARGDSSTPRTADGSAGACSAASAMRQSNLPLPGRAALGADSR